MRILREIAEKKVLADGPDTAPALNQLKLVHELQVHRIELEMQNEALVETIAQADAARARYQRLFESAPVAHLTLSSRDEITEINTRGAELLGQDKNRLTGKPLRNFFEPSSRERLDRFLSSVSTAGDESSEQSLLVRLGLPMPIYVTAQACVFRDPASGEQQKQLTMVDISALTAARQDVIHAIRASDAGQAR